jgi:EAL domain-containing protein (putative c-di-GMP-specific phosphodiesterase class I)
LVRITASLGIALSTHGTSTEELLGNADMAMYAAKAAGRNRATLFETDMHERIRERVSLEYDLVGAIDRGEMAVHYQPIVDLATGRVAAFEALLRWRHPERGNVPPTDFIPLAESNGHIERIGQWVLVQACRQLAAWQRAQRPGELPLRVCVNVSPQQLQSPSFVQQVGTVLRGCEIDPATLTLEITEHLLVTDPDIAGPLTALRELGVRIALDDFGTGYSAFGYLRRMPVHSLKLDRTFVDGLGTDDRQAALASAILHVADALDVEVVAEGIENIDQLQTLRRLGCQYGQGFVFGHGEAAGGRLAVERWVDLRERDSIPA